MFSDEILVSLFAGIGIAIVAGVLGCFILWGRMAYFSDSLAQSSLLTVALSILYSFNVNLGILIICSLFSLILAYCQYKNILSVDSILGILANSMLSVAIIIVAFMDNVDFSIHQYLFGDLDLIKISDLYWIYIGGLFIIVLIIINWSSLLLSTINEDLARAENLNVFAMNVMKMLLLSIFVAVSMRVLGILLITSMLLIPAATSRQLTKSPETMAIVSALIGIASMLLGLWMSICFDLPSGPIIIVVSTSIFVTFLIVLKIQSIAKS